MERLCMQYWGDEADQDGFCSDYCMRRYDQEIDERNEMGGVVYKGVAIGLKEAVEFQDSPPGGDYVFVKGPPNSLIYKAFSSFGVSYATTAADALAGAKVQIDKGLEA